MTEARLGPIMDPMFSLTRFTGFSTAFFAVLGCGSDETVNQDASQVDVPITCQATWGETGATSTIGTVAPLNHRSSAACCPTRRGSGPQFSSSRASTCTSDSQCTSGPNGRCFPFQGLVGPGGCSYDECFTDSDCGSKTPCFCRTSATDNSANVCGGPGNCAVDSDCGPGSYCSPSVQVGPNQTANVCGGSEVYYCHTAADLCVNDSDCVSPDGGPQTDSSPRCGYNLQENRWECVAAFCALP